MTLPKKLARILSDEIRGEFHLTIENEDGEIFQVRATEQQVADLIEELDDLLGDDAEEEDEVTEHKEMGDE
jgi:antitoxin component of MazEF toxin-antitoxin module